MNHPRSQSAPGAKSNVKLFPNQPPEPEDNVTDSDPSWDGQQDMNR